jgi:hypothetical protein
MSLARHFPDDIELRVPQRPCRHLFLVENRAAWTRCPFPYDKNTDLVLTFDFGLVSEIRALGGEGGYIDHILPTMVLEPHNIDVYRFLTSWFQDKNGRDIFSYRGIDLGSGLLSYLWFEVSHYARLLLSLQALRHIPRQKIYVGLKDPAVIDLVISLGFEIESWSLPAEKNFMGYFYPIAQYMDESVFMRRGMTARLKTVLSYVLDGILRNSDQFGLRPRAEADVFVQRYYPTDPVVASLKKESCVNVIVDYYTWRRGLWKESRLSCSLPSSHHRRVTDELIEAWSKRRSFCWTINGFSLSDILYQKITRLIKEVLPHGLSAVDYIIEEMPRRNLKAMVFVSNLGLKSRLLLDYCYKRKIPTYLILNGLLLHQFPEEELSETTHINSYGESIKRDYFQGDKRVVCLGDPRLDKYVINQKPREIDHETPTILIGSSGFSIIDLNSYAAVEFEFIHDLFMAFRTVQSRGKKFKLVVKVRPSSYIEQYRRLVDEYFQDLPIVFCRETIAFSRAIEMADFYISTYSGTLFEAACRGIPTLYYKNDAELLIAPYNGNSELVTARNVEEAVDRIDSFYRQDPIYDVFLSRDVIEKYVGPLDGNSTRRNVDFIYSMVKRAPVAESLSTEMAPHSS